MLCAAQVLDRFRDAGIKQVIVSSSEKNWLMRYAERYGILDYFDGREIDRDSKVWDLHNNVFEKGTVAVFSGKEVN